MRTPCGCSGHPIVAGARQAHDGAIARALVTILLAAAWALPGAAHAQTPPPALSYELRGAVDPARAGWLDEALQEARERGAPLVILRLDTSGGLDSSMRRMVQAIIAAPMPVVVHVAPEGARAASAGLFVTLAGDVAAMAPRTSIGAASPVILGGDDTGEVLGRTVRNDAAAYVRALADGRRRDAGLAERMVRDAVSVTAETAAARRLVEVVAADEAALLRMLDGHRLADGRALQTEGIRVERREMPLRVRIQALLVNPTVAYLLLLCGLLGVALGALSPSLLGPGLFGAVSLVLGLYGAAQLPVSAAGALLLLLAVALLAAETRVPSRGALGLAGAAALSGGGLLLFDTDSDAFSVSVVAAVSTGVAAALLSTFVAARALRRRQGPAHGEPEELLGALGTVRTPLDPEGWVVVDGALWRARTGVVPGVPAGARVRVDGKQGATLNVRPLAGERTSAWFHPDR